MKTGFVAIVGRPNVGKSTLLNSIIGEKLSIVTSKSQTTRNSIKGIYNAENVQIVFVDTPGIHKPFKKLGKEMNSMAYGSTHGADVVILVVDSSLPFGSGDEYVYNHLDFDSKLIVCFNKIDETNVLKMEELKSKYRSLYKDALFVETVAKQKINVDELLKLVISLLLEGEPYYPNDMKCDRDFTFSISEIIREKALPLLKEEVPHSLAIRVTSFRERGKNALIEAIIIVEKESQKGIVIGKNGLMIKKIGVLARNELEKKLNKHVLLSLVVRVKNDWRDDSRSLGEFGYLHKNN